MTARQGRVLLECNRKGEFRIRHWTLQTEWERDIWERSTYQYDAPSQKQHKEVSAYLKALENTVFPNRAAAVKELEKLENEFGVRLRLRKNRH